MAHFAVILWEAEVNDGGVLKLQVFVGSMRWILSINTPSAKVDCEIDWMVSKYKLIALTY